MTELEEQTEKMSQPVGEQPPQQRRTWLKAIWGIAILVLLIALLLNTCGTKQQGNTLERELAAEMGLLPGMTEEEIQDRLNRTVAESMMNVSINPTPVFPSGTQAGNIRIENIPGNSCSFTVSVVRSDTGETILSTGIIDPGYYVEYVELDTPLPKGEYSCVAVFTGYDTQTLEQLGQAGTTLLLTVES